MTGTLAASASSRSPSCLAGADHDRVGVAREHARGVADGLAAAELQVAGVQHHAVAAELAHGDLERDAGPGRGLFEDHHQRLAGERPVRLLALPALCAVASPSWRVKATMSRSSLVGARSYRENGGVPCLRDPPPASRARGKALRGRDRGAPPLPRSPPRSRSAAAAGGPVVAAADRQQGWSRSAVTNSLVGSTALTPISRPSPRTSTIMPARSLDPRRASA